MGFVAAQLKNMMKRFLIITSEQQFCIGSKCLLSIGNAYLAVDKKQEALSAFRSSYQMDYDAKVKKLAHEQYAKLSYDIGNPFESPSAVIQIISMKIRMRQCFRNEIIIGEIISVFRKL
jgi:hypothetical protein